MSAAARLAREQAALRRVATLVAQGASQEELFTAVNEEVGRIVGADGTSLLRFEADDSLTLVAAWREREATFPIGDRRPLNGAMQALRARGRPMRFDVLPAKAPFLEEAQDLGVRSAVGVPIAVDGRVWGIVFATCERPDPLPADAEEHIAAFTELVATALSNAQARAELQQLANEQAALRRVAELVARGVPQRRLFAAVASEASKLIEDEATTLLRFDDDGRATVVAVCGGPAPVGARFLVGSDDPGTPAEVLRTGRPARVDDYAAAGEPAYARRFRVGSSVGAPIVVEDRIWGMIGATTPDRPLPAAAEQRLQQFAELAAAALANAQARTDLQRLADEQAALRRVAELVARSPTREGVLDAVVSEASGLLGGAGVALSRYEPTGVATILAVCRSPAPVGMRVPTDGATCHGQVLRTGRAHRVTTFDGTPLEGEARRLGVESAVGVPVTVEGRVWGMLSTTVPGRPPPPDTEERLAQFAGLVGTAIANAESRAQLTASRARVVAAADESRRRLQRDVHDGAQQRLVQTVITLKLARQALAGRPGKVADLVEEGLHHAERATAELRDLVRGILPASLTRGGLRAGVDSLAGDLPLPVDVDVAQTRLAPQTETTAYFVVAEALTNVVKHAGATHAAVRAHVDGSCLRVEVSDDGAGGASAGTGSGLTGLFDRVEACDGTLQIVSPPGRGTTIRALLPLG